MPDGAPPQRDLDADDHDMLTHSEVLARLHDMVVDLRASIASATGQGEDVSALERRLWELQEAAARVASTRGAGDATGFMTYRPPSR